MNTAPSSQAGIAEGLLLDSGLSASSYMVRVLPGIPGLCWPTEDRDCGHHVTILEISIPPIISGISLPSFQVLRQDIWTVDLVRAVTKLLRDQTTSPQAFAYLAESLEANFSVPKELHLSDGSTLIGWLDYSYGYGDRPPRYELQVIGKISDGKGKTIDEDLRRATPVTLLTISNLSSEPWPVPASPPHFEKNKAVWCKDLESLVIRYLRQLAMFADSFIAEQLTKMIAKIENDSDWAKSCRTVHKRLRQLSPKRQADPRIAEAIRLIATVSGAAPA